MKKTSLFCWVYILYLCLQINLFAHNEYLTVVNSQWAITNNATEAFRWTTPSDLKIELFANASAPWELDLTTVTSRFRQAYQDWENVSGSCYEFAETALDAAMNHDRVEVYFTSDESIFNDPAYEGATTNLDVNISNKQFIYSNNNGYPTTIFGNATSARLFEFSLINQAVYNKINISHVFLHEIGHLVGLAHCTASNNPVMYETITIGAAPRVSLREPDKQGIQSYCDNNAVQELLSSNCNSNSHKKTDLMKENSQNEKKSNTSKVNLIIPNETIIRSKNEN